MNPTPTPEQIAQMSYEVAKAALESLTTNLERGQLSLSDSLTAYRTAQQLATRITTCFAEVEAAAQALVATPS